MFSLLILCLISGIIGSAGKFSVLFFNPDWFFLLTEQMQQNKWGANGIHELTSRF